MNRLHLTFERSAPNVESLPEDKGAEIISIGYSNVGKSSFINAIANERNLAKCSKTPGRTQLFNIFSLDENKRIIDLPGYGFAKASRKKQTAWQHNLQEYLSQRLCLKGIVLVTDIRRGLRQIDQDIINWAQEQQVEILIILNKADKLSKNEIQKAETSLQRQYSITSDQYVVCSCTKKTGVSEALEKIKHWLREDV